MPIARNLYLVGGLVLLAGPAAAATWYATPEGAGTYAGTNWDNAFSNVQAAVNAATNAGDVI
jgi:hypothetical protein